MRCKLCVNVIIVKNPFHRDNPTLSALQFGIQLHEDIITFGDLLGCSECQASGLDGQAVAIICLEPV